MKNLVFKFTTTWLCFLFFSLNSHAEKVKLVRALGSNEEPQLDKAIEVSLSDFTLLEQESWWLFFPGKSPYKRSFNRIEQRLGEEDQMTILETAVQRLGERSLGSLKGNIYTAREILVHNYDTNLELMERIHGALEQELKLDNAPVSYGTEVVKSYYDQETRSVIKNMRNIPVLISLLLKLESLNEQNSKWNDLLERTYQATRSEFVHLDYKIKIAKQTHPEIAEKMAAMAVSTVLGAQDAREEKVFLRLFDGIEENFRFVVDGHRYITRSADWFMTKIATPLKEWSFSAAIFTSIVAGSAGLMGFDSFSSDIATLAAGTVFTWLGLFALEIYNPALIGISFLLDKTINLISRPFTQNRAGNLSAQLLNAETIILERGSAESNKCNLVVK